MGVQSMNANSSNTTLTAANTNAFDNINLTVPQFNKSNQEYIGAADAPAEEYKIDDPSEVEGVKTDEEISQYIEEHDEEMITLTKELEELLKKQEELEEAVSKYPPEDDMSYYIALYDGLNNNSTDLPNKDTDELTSADVSGYYDRLNEIAQEYGYNSFEEMRAAYERDMLCLHQVEASLRVTNKKIEERKELIRLFVKYSEEMDDFNPEIVTADVDNGSVSYSNPEADIYSHLCAWMNLAATHPELLDPAYINTFPEDIRNLYYASQLDPDLGKMYQLIYSTQGAEAAQAYLDSIKDHINELAGNYLANQFIDGLINSNDPEEAIRTFLEGFGDGADSFVEGLADSLSADGTLSADDYKRMMILKYLVSDPAWNDELYSAGLTAGNLVIPLVVYLALQRYDALAATIVPSVVSGLISGVSAYGNTTNDLLANGITVEEARAIGAVEGVLTTTYWLAGGAASESLLGRFAAAYTSGDATLIRSVLASMGANSVAGASLGAASFASDCAILAQEYLRTRDYSDCATDAEVYQRAYADAYATLGGDEGLKDRIAEAAAVGAAVGGVPYTREVLKRLSKLRGEFMDDARIDDAYDDIADNMLDPDDIYTSEDDLVPAAATVKPDSVVSSFRFRTMSQIMETAKTIRKEEEKKT